MNTKSDFYKEEDLVLMKEIIKMIDMLPNTGQIQMVKGGLLSKEQEKFICEKGHKNNKDVEFCRKCYAEGRSSRDVWNQYYSTIIPYNSFQKMWHGYTWKHIMPEVFLHNPRPKLKYGAKERDDILQDFYQSKMSMRQYCKVSRFKVGYGTLWKMINDPEFYNSK